jgi:DNA adenine methylase
MPVTETGVKTLLSWAGGKTKLISTIFNESGGVPKNGLYDLYVEPFMGGGGAAKYFLGGHTEDFQPIFRWPCTPMILSDSNADVINFFAVIRGSKTLPLLYQELVKQKQEYSSSGDKEKFFLDVRDRLNSPGKAKEGPVDVGRAVLFYVFNRLCFNGLTRYNSKGEINTPFGKKKSLFLPSLDHFDDWHSLLQSASLKVGSFEETLNSVFKTERKYTKALIYCDPPYFSKSGKGFTGYTPQKFDLEATRRLVDMLFFTQHQNIHSKRVVLSNSIDLFNELVVLQEGQTREEVSKVFPDKIALPYGTSIVSISAPRSISASADGRLVTKEIVIFN